MSLSNPNVICARLKMEVEQPVVIPLANNLKIDLPIYFQNVANLQVLSGTYTPNNDTLTAVNSILSANAPNFILLFCDGQLNLTIETAASNMINYGPISKIGFFTLVPSIPYAVTNIIFDGTTAASNPMPQMVAVDYTLVIGQATIS